MHDTRASSHGLLGPSALGRTLVRAVAVPSTAPGGRISLATGLPSGIIHAPNARPGIGQTRVASAQVLAAELRVHGHVVLILPLPRGARRGRHGLLLRGRLLAGPDLEGGEAARPVSGGRPTLVVLVTGCI